MRYPVNELFTTIQGEAQYAGTPSFFIRLQGCPVGCGWCDTKHTWDMEEETSDPRQIIDKDRDDNTFHKFPVDALLKLVEKSGVKHVVLTGGEPCLYDLNPLCVALHENNFSVQIETSGTHIIKTPQKTWVTVSPKINMPGGFKVLPEAIARANEIKLPVGKQADVDNFLATFKLPKGIDFWLQPLSLSKKATALCVELAITHNWKVSVQTHKYYGVR